jgi:hypothetical protein
MSAALLRHESLIADAVAHHGGRLLKSKGEGDSTFSVFEEARDAVGAAVEAQQGLRRESWPVASPITVRMAVHSGEAVERDGDYFGRAVNRGARLRAIAAGGEVLLSSTTAGLVLGKLPPGVQLTGLGLQQLKDLDGPETVYQLIDDGQLLVRRPLRAPLGPLPLPRRIRAGCQPCLVGRAAELDRLAAAWAHARDGGCALVVIEGDAGIGKSRLVNEFAAWVYENDGVVLAGQCTEMSHAPYQPFVDIAAFVLERTPLAEPADISAAEAAALARLVPALVPEPGPHQVADAQTERDRLMLGAGSWLHRQASGHSLLVLVEDVHWAADGTVAMLRAALQALAQDPCLVLVTTRPHSDLTLAEDSRQLGVRYDAIALRGLTETETRELLEPAEPTIGPERAAEVHTYTAGNPLFALSLAAAVAKAGDGPVAALELPETVHAVLQQQLDRLDGDTLSFLRAAAVLGTTFEVDLAVELAGASFAVVEHALDAGERHRVVREEAAGVVHTYQFSHALVAAALVGQLSSIRRRRLHAAAVGLLAHAPYVVGDRPSRAAHHAELAGPMLPVGQAIQTFRAAASDAGNRMALAEAVHWLDVAGAAAARLADPRLAVELDAERGAAALAAGVPGARTDLVAAAERAWALGDAELFADALSSGDMNGSGEFLRADATRIALLERAIDAIPPEDLRRRTRLLVSLSDELIYAGDGAGRRFALADEALELARHLGDVRLLDLVSDHRLRLFSGPTRVRQRLEETSDRLRRLDATSVPWAQQFQLLASQCQVCEQLGRIEEGHTYLAQLRGLAERSELIPRHVLGVELLSAGWELLEGRLAEAEATVRRARPLVESTGMYSLGLATARLLLGVRFWRDRVDSMLGSVAAGVSLFPAFAAHWAYWLLQADRVSESAEIWAQWNDDNVEDLLDAGDGSESFVLEAAGVCAMFDGAGRCRYYYALLEPFADQLLNPFAPDQPTHHYLGLLAHGAGNLEQAAAHFEASREHARRLGAPLMVGRASLELGRVLQSQGLLGDRPIELAREAVEIGTQLDATWLVRNGDALLAQLKPR